MRWLIGLARSTCEYTEPDVQMGKNRMWVQEENHKDVKTTMIYTHVLNRGGRGVKNPADTLWEQK